MNSSDPFAERLALRKSSQVQPTSEEKDPFRQALQNRQQKAASIQEETTPEYLLRGAARLGSRVLETGLGFPGDVIEMVKAFGEATGAKKDEPTYVQKFLQDVLNKLPTSQQLKEKSEAITKGYTAPQSEEERFFDEAVGLGTALAIPLKDPTKFTSLLKQMGKDLPKSIAKATAAKGVGAATEGMFESEKAGAAAELGSLFLMSMLPGSGVGKFISSKHQRARSLIPEGTMLKTEGLVKNLDLIEKDLSGILAGPTSEKVLPKVRELRSNLKGDVVEGDKLLDAYVAVNEHIADRNLFQGLDTGQRKLLRTKFDKLKSAIKGPLEDYGQHNKEFWKEWNEANRASAIKAQSDFVMNTIKKPSVAKAVTGTTLGYVVGAPTTVGAVVGAAASHKVGQVLYRMAKDPSLRKHYSDFILNASIDNLPAAVRSANKFNEEFDKK
jgi:hypothetical protein